MARESSNSDQKALAAQGDARKERYWKSGMTWPPELPFTLVLQRARQQDQQALSALYKRFLPVVYRFVLARVSDQHLAEDLTADTFFAVVKDIGVTRASDELGFSAWVLGIARTRVLQHFRRQHVRMEAERELAPSRAEPLTRDDEDDPLEIITARENWGTIVAALNRLTEDQRSVVLYRCILGYSAEEVGDLLDKNPGTVRALQFRALASLSRHLGFENKSGRSRQKWPGAEGAHGQRSTQAGRNDDADRG